MGDIKDPQIMAIWLVAPGIQAEGELRASFEAGGDGPGKGYHLSLGVGWARVAKPGEFRADIPFSSIRAVIYKPEDRK